jgi:long-chain acyl-CoA synthetase
MLENPYIEEVLVYGINDKKNDDIVVKAEIYPNHTIIEEKFGSVTEDGLHDIIKDAVEDVNDKMPTYKRVKRFELRGEEFEKTTTRKIKRMGGAVREEEDA